MPPNLERNIVPPSLVLYRLHARAPQLWKASYRAVRTNILKAPIYLTRVNFILDKSNQRHRNLLKSVTVPRFYKRFN